MHTLHLVAWRGAAFAVLALGALASARAAESAPPQNQVITSERDEEKSLDQSWQVANDATIEVHNVRGSVIVSAGEGERVKLSGTLGRRSKLVVSGNDKHLQLQVEGSEGRGWFGNHGPDDDTNLVLSVPHAAALKIDVVSADVKVAGLDGKSLNVDAVSGAITLAGAAPQVDIENVSGDVKFDSANHDSNARMHLQTVSGDIDAHGGAGRIKLETVSGSVTLRTAEVQEIEAGTVSGTIDIQAVPAKRARLKLETMSGSVRLNLPATLSAHIEAETFSGGLHSDFGKVQKPEYGPGSSLDARVGDADAQISAQAFSGDVEIRKQ